ncbi:MAG: DUF1579 domain-containing protein [Phycisphaerales bacterium]|nr:DUF1579 domain-containing protein [Phycisphaerales bacterium]
MQAEPQKEHQWLQQMCGEWTSEATCSGGPGQPDMVMKGTESVRPLGLLWIICKGKGEMPGGGEANMRLTLGYDPAKKMFVGSWIGSMMTHMWTYEGQLDVSGKVLTLDTTGPNMMEPGKTERYRETIEMKSADHRTFSSSMMGPDGKWATFMTAQYRRVK